MQLYYNPAAIPAMHRTWCYSDTTGMYDSISLLICLFSGLRASALDPSFQIGRHRIVRCSCVSQSHLCHVCFNSPPIQLPSVELIRDSLGSIGVAVLCECHQRVCIFELNQNETLTTDDRACTASKFSPLPECSAPSDVAECHCSRFKFRFCCRPARHRLARHRPNGQN